MYYELSSNISKIMYLILQQITGRMAIIMPHDFEFLKRIVIGFGWLRS